MKNKCLNFGSLTNSAVNSFQPLDELASQVLYDGMPAKWYEKFGKVSEGTLQSSPPGSKVAEEFLVGFFLFVGQKMCSDR